MNEDEQLTTQDVADKLGVKSDTVSAYRSRGLFPEPDGQLGRTVWWLASTIEAWAKDRPGRGWRKDKGTRYRDAVDGQYVTKEEADARPRETISERVRDE